ncbi:MAG: ribosome maturation factor RimP [Eubacteriales bacterium]
MSKPQKNKVAVICNLLEHHINNLGYELWDIEYVKEGSEWYLRITIDKPEGIFIDDCEKVHRLIEPLLDETDPIEDAYRLEVSSPGIERELRTDRHFITSVGKEITLKLFTAFNGKKLLRGILGSYENGIITIIEPDDNELKIERTAVSRANIYFNYN